MKFKLSAIALFIQASMLLASPAQAQFSTGGLSPQDTSAVEKVIEQYLLKNPGIIQQAMALQQQRAERAEQERSAETLKSKSKEIFENNLDMVLGNPKGDVTIVEFFDFRCGYCKRAHSVVKALLNEDKNVRVVLKQLPILGPESLRATQAGMAAAKQNKYAEFHNKLFEMDQVNSQSIADVVLSLGLDKKQFDSDVADEKVWAPSVNSSNILASDLGVNGTPAFIVGSSLIPGAIDIVALKNLVATTRASKAKQ